MTQTDDPSVVELLRRAEQRFSGRNPKSRDHMSRAAAFMPGGNTRTVLFYEPFPLVMARGEGCRLWDLDGHDYVDFLGEFTAGIYGHSHPTIREAIRDAVGNGLNLAAPHVLEARLAQAICGRFPTMELLRFTNSGTEANLVALATAKAFTGRSKILAFEGAYHGATLSFVGESRALNVPHEFAMAPYNDCTATRDLIRKLGSDLAAVIVEPMLGSGGCIPATPEFLGVVRDMTREVGALLIFDEVMTSRLAPGGLQESSGIRADLTTMGKYIGGGSSIGVFGGRADIMSLFDPRQPDALSHAGTFNNNTISMAAGLAGLTRVYTRDAAVGLNQRGAALRKRLNAVCSDAGVALQFTGIGSLIGIHATDLPVLRPAKPTEHQKAIKSLLFFELLESGLYLAKRGFIALSLMIGDEEAARLVEAIRDFAQRHRYVLR